MRRLIFLLVAAALQTPRPVAAQVVPGRDLLGYPVGTAGEAPVLATSGGDGLWNPAAIALSDRTRWRAGVGAADTPAAQGLGVQSAWLAAALPGHFTGGVSVLRASVRDITRTDDVDPTARGELPYGTLMASATAAAPVSRWVTGGVAVRYRRGELGALRRGSAGVDGGLLAGGGWWHDVRLGVATVLWRPGASSDEAAYSGGVDLRAAGVDSLAEVRLGYAQEVYDGEGAEHYVFAAARRANVALRGGLLATREYGQLTKRVRLGLGMRFATYYVAVARETSPFGDAGTYLFTLTTTGQ